MCDFVVGVEVGGLESPGRSKIYTVILLVFIMASTNVIFITIIFIRTRKKEEIFMG